MGPFFRGKKYNERKGGEGGSLSYAKVSRPLERLLTAPLEKKMSTRVRLSPGPSLHIVTFSIEDFLEPEI